MNQVPKHIFRLETETLNIQIIFRLDTETLNIQTFDKPEVPQ